MIAGMTMGSAESLAVSQEFTKQMALLAPVIAALFGALCILSLLALCLSQVALFPSYIGRTSYSIERKPGQSFLTGLAIMLLAMPIAAVLFFSLIGIAFIPAYIIILAAAAFFGYTAISQLLGKKILKGLRMGNKPMMLEVAVGFIFFQLVGMVPIIGCLIMFIAATMGLGAAYATRFGFRD